MRKLEQCLRLTRSKPPCYFNIALCGRYSRDFFNRYGDLRHIRRLRFWPMNKVLTEKYNFSERDAIEMAEFIIPILDFVPEKRPSAAQLLQHPWLDSGPRLRQPKEPSVDPISDKKKEDDDKEAMSNEMGNIKIDNTSKHSNDSPRSNGKARKVDTVSTSA